MSSLLEGTPSLAHRLLTLRIRRLVFASLVGAWLIPTVCLLLALASPAWAAVTVDAVGTPQWGTGTSVNIPITLGAVSNSAVVLYFSGLSSTAGITASIGGVALSIISGSNGGTLPAEVLLGAVITTLTGAQTMSVSWTTSQNYWVNAMSFHGVNQTTPFNGGTYGSGASPYSKTITSNSGDLTTTINGTTATATTNQTQKWSVTGNGSTIEGDVGPGTGTTTHTWTSAGQTMYVSGANIAQATCGAVSDPSYVADNAQPTQAIVYWASANPVVILEKSGSAITDVPTNGTTYTAGNTIGASTVKFAGSRTSYTRTGLTNGTTYYYKVFANSSLCYSPGTSTQVIARPVAAPIPAWSYNFAGGSILVAGIAGTSTLYTSSNASRIIGLSTGSNSTPNGTQLWAPLATNAPIQAYLTWLPAASGWLYRKQITINHTKVSATLTNFPVLINITDSGAQSLQTSAQASGNDIFFTAADGATKLNHEIETYTSSTGQLVAWVQVPSLSNTTDTVIYMYYGNPSASNQQNVTGTWDTNYMAVWHLKESGNGTAGEFNDSTGPNDGQGGAGTLSAVPAQATGEIGYGQSFNGNDYIQVPNSTSLSTSITSQLTMEAWVNLPTPTNNQKIVGKTPTTAGYLLGVGTGLYPEIWDTAGTHYGFTTTTTITANTWTHLAVTWTTGGNMIGYINGVPATGGSIAASANNIGTTTNVLRIGATPWSTPPTQFFVTGLIDEVRISNTARSAAWISTENNNQCPTCQCPTCGFYSVGTTQTDSSLAVFGADQNGYVYSVDASGGATTWSGQPNAGVDKFQAPVAAQAWGWSNTAFQSTYNDDVLFVATQNGSGTTTNKLYALKRRDGTKLWSFSPGNMDMIVGMPWVDYARNYVYVTSYSKGNTQPSLWVINSLTGALVASGSFSLNDIAAAPTMSVDGSTLYVATVGGNLYALNMSTLAYKWTGVHYAALGNAVQGFIWENGDLLGTIYFATTDGNVWCLKDPGSGQAPPSVTVASCTGWSAVKTAVAGAKTPVPLGNPLGKLYVGASDGKVHQLNLTSGVDEDQYCLNPPGSGSCTAITVGDVSTETGNEIFVPTSDGTVYKLPVPLP